MMTDEMRLNRRMRFSKLTKKGLMLQPVKALQKVVDPPRIIPQIVSRNAGQEWLDIHSWVAPGIYKLYAKMVHKFDNAVFMELGTWVGKSTVCMALEIKRSGKNIKFYAVDFFQDCYLTYSGFYENDLHGAEVRKRYFENIEPYKDYVNTIVGKTHDICNEFKDEAFDFIFIDADHEYNAVKKDIELWYPKIKKGGIIAGHDYDKEQWGGVCKAVDEIFPDAEIIYSEGGNCWLKYKK